MDGNDGDAELGRTSSLEDTGKMAAIRREDLAPGTPGTRDRRVDIGIVVVVVAFSIIAVVALLWPSPKPANHHVAARQNDPRLGTIPSIPPESTTTAVTLPGESTLPAHATTSVPSTSKVAAVNVTTTTTAKKTHKTTTTVPRTTTSVPRTTTSVPRTTTTVAVTTTVPVTTTTAH